MAQTLYTGNVQNPTILGSASVAGLEAVHEPQGNNPYVALYIAIQSVGETDLAPTPGAGRLRCVVNYSDNTNTQVALDEDPLSDVPSIPRAAPLWFAVRTNGKLRQIRGARPTAGITVAADERHALASGKTLVDNLFFWTDD